MKDFVTTFLEKAKQVNEEDLPQILDEMKQTLSEEDQELLETFTLFVGGNFSQQFFDILDITFNGDITKTSVFLQKNKAILLECIHLYSMEQAALLLEILSKNDIESPLLQKDHYPNKQMFDLLRIRGKTLRKEFEKKGNQENG